MENKPQRLLKVKDAAAYLSLSHRKVRKLVADGDIPYIQLDYRRAILQRLPMPPRLYRPSA